MAAPNLLLWLAFVIPTSKTTTNNATLPLNGGIFRHELAGVGPRSILLLDSQSQRLVVPITPETYQPSSPQRIAPNTALASPIPPPSGNKTASSCETMQTKTYLLQSNPGGLPPRLTHLKDTYSFGSRRHLCCACLKTTTAKTFATNSNRALRSRRFAFAYSRGFFSLPRSGVFPQEKYVRGDNESTRKASYDTTEMRSRCASGYYFSLNTPGGASDRNCFHRLTLSQVRGGTNKKKTRKIDHDLETRMGT